jgi:molybdopterin-containing oxidoreductase family membrane subunit
MKTLVSVYDLPSEVSTVVRKLKARGFDDLTTYSPAPFEEIELAEDPKPSKVRAFTLIGGLAGLVTGFGIQIWMSMDWPIKIAGKNFAAIPPMWIIGFELTILFGGILTILGLVGLGGLYPRPLDEHYSPRFSAEEFGVVVNCDERDVAEVESLMRGHNAKEVVLHDAH